MLYPVAFTLLRELSHPIILSQVHFVLGFVHAYFNIVNYIKKIHWNLGREFST